MNLIDSLFLALALAPSISIFADPAAASIATGGLVVIGHEPRIVMAKEVLRISKNRVIVDYDFRNDSDENITTEVAFPIPDYAIPDDERFTPSDLGLNYFKLWVNGTPRRYHVEARAILNEKDYTEQLVGMGIDVATLGHQNISRISLDLRRLSADQREQLEQAGLINHDDGEPTWKVRKKYY